jgi:hypothetical protein
MTNLQSPEGEWVLSYPFHDCLGVLGPCYVDAKEHEALNLLHYSTINENGGVLGAPFPVVHNLVLITLRERL